MNRKFLLLGIAAAVLLVLPALAQEKPKMTAEEQAMMEVYAKAGSPGEAHQALAQAAGSYDLKVKSWSAPGAPPAEDAGTATRKMALDGRVLMEELSTTMMGQPYKGQGMQGYDNVTGKYWATWIDSMSTGLMLSEGACDAKGTCTFTGTYNDPIKKGPATLRMTSRWTSPKTQVFEMYGAGPDGKDMKMMEITYNKRS